MLGLGKLWQALSRLADMVNALADTAAEVNEGIRARAGLDAPPRHDLLEAGPEAANGEADAPEGTGEPRKGRGRR